MKYICGAPGNKSWFRIETEAEAELESRLMDHAVAKHFKREWRKAACTYKPTPGVHSFEQNIGLKAHIQKAMPRFLTLRNADGDGLATAMLPPTNPDSDAFRSIVVGRGNRDPYDAHGEAIRALAAHLDLILERADCYPYDR